jgi:hypothetical protein
MDFDFLAAGVYFIYLKIRTVKCTEKIGPYGKN